MQHFPTFLVVSCTTYICVHGILVSLFCHVELVLQCSQHSCQVSWGRCGWVGWGGCACKVPPLNPTKTEFWTEEKTNNTGPKVQAQRVDSSFGNFSPLAEIERNFMLSDVPNSLPKDVCNPMKTHNL